MSTKASAGRFYCSSEQRRLLTGFPSLATDYIEDGICLNRLSIPHPSATSIVEFGGLQYVIERSLATVSGSVICYKVFGEVANGKLMGRAIITQDGDAIEGGALSDVTVIGTVVLTITQHHDFNCPAI